MLGQKINYEPEITHQEMLDYYHEHAAGLRTAGPGPLGETDRPLRSLPQPGGRLGGPGPHGQRSLAGVRRWTPSPNAARRARTPATAASHDWTTQGSLASEVLDQAIFTLPVGQLSERLEDEREFHIVRVIERRDASRVPFDEAQVEIKETLRKEKINEAGQRLHRAEADRLRLDDLRRTRPDAPRVAIPPTAAPEIADPRVKSIYEGLNPSRAKPILRFFGASDGGAISCRMASKTTANGSSCSPRFRPSRSGACRFLVSTSHEHGVIQ